MYEVRSLTSLSTRHFTGGFLSPHLSSYGCIIIPASSQSTSTEYLQHIFRVIPLHFAMLALTVKLLSFALAVLMASSDPTFKPTFAPISKKPTSGPTYQIDDCTATTCNVYFGSSFLVSPGSISARVYLPAEFTLTFSIRRPILSVPGNNIFEIRATDAKLGSDSLLTFGLDSQGVSNTVYNGQLLQATGVVADYTNTYTTFTVTYASNVLSVQSSAEPNTITMMPIVGEAVNTDKKLFYLYTSSPSAKDASIRPLLQLFSLGGKRSFNVNSFC